MVENDQITFFDDIILQRKFVTYEAVMSAVEEFEHMSGGRYSLTKREKCGTNQLNAASLKFKRLEFKCKKRKMAGCQAYYNFYVREGAFYVSSHHVVHNHDLIEEVEDEGNYIVECDLTSEFLEIFNRTHYANFDEVKELMNKYEEQTGSVFRVLRSSQFHVGQSNNGLEYRQYDLQCTHGGIKTSNVPLEAQRRSWKLDCKAEVRFYARGDHVEITKRCLQHNHRVFMAMGVNNLSKRKLSSEKDPHNLSSSIAVTIPQWPAIGNVDLGTSSSPNRPNPTTSTNATQHVTRKSIKSRKSMSIRQKLSLVDDAIAVIQHGAISLSPDVVRKFNKAIVQLAPTLIEYSKSSAENSINYLRSNSSPNPPPPSASNSQQRNIFAPLFTHLPTNRKQAPLKIIPARHRQKRSRIQFRPSTPPPLNENIFHLCSICQLPCEQKDSHYWQHCSQCDFPVHYACDELYNFYIPYYCCTCRNVFGV